MVEVGSDIKGLKDLAKNSGKLKKSFAGTTLRTALRNAAQAGTQSGEGQGGSR